ncbi:AraC family transcriptional regulator [Bosea sp. (in: a-proteobacteria)]|uniref:helix-turn-helix transcriptional regulator n=1 Tax=Bosea sp. (in: a-proteobacteria) TaxID=1871050 RepID=UPI003341C831
MALQNLIPSGGMTASDIVRLGAAFSLGAQPVDVSPRELDTPLYTGRLLAHEVQPGLTVTASDITYVTNQDLTVDMEPTLLCGVMLKGCATETEVIGYGRVTRCPERVHLMGFGVPMRYRSPVVSGQRFLTAGFFLKPAFFARFGGDLADDGLATLQELVTGEFRMETLARSARLLEIARLCHEHPYRGQLAELFLESNALSYVVEVAELLKQERRMIALMGRRQYERVLEAREILDSDLVNTPTSLQLARRVGVNVTTLQTNFKAVFGTTIFGHVRDQRLLMARVLLQEHGLGVAEAAHRVGFSRPSAFSAAYRKYFGCSPRSEIRQGKGA